ncbi:hypothetical protein TSUD_18830 [Trifolium subterraneum]|uniref:Uncharacterized protein n=1 Tax=Trifolium subterraneum TaxID=3900 RepID=A0A2Z6ML35_TRISU|nr:hypothetical protein TSUD_18830 [Trifolium subterraneum]
MVSFFSVRNKEQENNNASSVPVTNDHGDPCFKKNPSSLFAVKNNPSSSSVEDVTDDDRVCLHFSVGDPCCLSCDHQQQITTNKKKRKRPQQQQQTLKNKKTRIINWEEEEDDHSICLHLLLVPINMVLPSEGSTKKRKISTSKKKKGSKLVRE